jgi:hypothetical protein
VRAILLIIAVLLFRHFGEVLNIVSPIRDIFRKLCCLFR